MLWAHVFTSLVALAISLAVVLLAGVAIGFRPHANLLQWLGVIGILGVFALAMTWLAVLPGLLASTPDGAGAFAYPLIFLPFISSAFVPTESMPTALRVFAENQPVTSIVDALRNLLAGQPAGSDIWVALAWCVGILVIAYVASTAAYRRKLA